ncbi:hypothetical protein SRHO_G00005740 [Serrasalmus rhombeus]
MFRVVVLLEGPPEEDLEAAAEVGGTCQTTGRKKTLSAFRPRSCVSVKCSGRRARGRERRKVRDPTGLACDWPSSESGTPVERAAESSFPFSLLPWRNVAFLIQRGKQRKTKTIASTTSEKGMTMASGGFRANAATDFLEEWKAKREKMRAKMLGDIAAATGQCPPPGLQGTGSTGTKAPEPSNNGSSAAVNCVSYPMARSSSSSALRRPEDDPGSRPADTPVKKAPDTSPTAATACQDSDKESPPHGKGKEKKSTGPSARKGKGQIEKRKLREKRRSTGVVSIPSNESLDELDDDDGGEKERKREEALTQHNTVQNESMTSDPAGHSIQDTPRSGTSRHKTEEDAGNRHRQGYSRHGRESTSPTRLERRIEELEKELALERQENSRLLKSHQDKDELIVKLKEEIDLLNRDLDDIEDENEQLKQENKTLLKVVGQLTR